MAKEAMTVEETSFFEQLIRDIASMRKEQQQMVAFFTQGMLADSRLRNE